MSNIIKHFKGKKAPKDPNSPKRRRSVGELRHRKTKSYNKMPKKLYSQSTKLQRSGRKTLAQAFLRQKTLSKFRSSFTLQQANPRSIVFNKQRRFSRRHTGFNTAYVSVEQLPPSTSNVSAQITSSKKQFMQPYILKNAKMYPASCQYVLTKNIEDKFHGQSFTHQRKFNTSVYQPGQRQKDPRTAEREPSVHDYNIIPKTIGIGRFRATFESRGKMFNEMNQDRKNYPSPQNYKVKPAIILNSRYNGINFPKSKRKTKKKTLGQGPAAYYCPGGFETFARKTFNIRFKAETYNNHQSWKVKRNVRDRLRNRKRKYKQRSINTTNQSLRRRSKSPGLSNRE